MQASNTHHSHSDADPAENQSRLALAILESTSDAIVGINTDQEIFLFNPAAERVFGYAQHEVLGQRLDVLIEPEAVETHREHVRRFLESGEYSRFMANRREILGRRRNGETFPASATIMRLELLEGTFLVATLVDLSQTLELERKWYWIAELLDASPDFVAAADAQGIPFYHNRGARDLLGLGSDEEFHHWRIPDSHPEWAAQRVLKEGFPAAAKHGYWEGETALRGKDGTEIPVSQLLVAKHGRTGEVEGFATVARDLRAYKRMVSHLESLSSALAQSADMVWIADTEGRLVYVNPAFEQATGYPAHALCGRPALEVFRESRADPTYVERLNRLFEEAEGFSSVHSFRNAADALIHVDETVSVVHEDGGPVSCYVGVGRDISERLALQSQLRELAYHDQLTGLPNRYLFYEHLEHALDRAARTGNALAVVFIDLDGFKRVNDNHGHSIGDTVLCEVARRLNAAIRRQDTLARLGGDEFLLLMENLPLDSGTEPGPLVEAVRRIFKALDRPIRTHNLQFRISASAGISTYPTDGSHRDELIRHADLAMFQAKNNGEIRYRFYAPKLSARASERLYLEQELRLALEHRDDWDLVYQPIIDLASKRPVYVEALARWNHPRDGLIGPDRFIPVAEETGLIKPLGRRVLATACRQLAEWRAQGVPVERVAVNVSARQLTDGHFVRDVRQILEETGLAGEQLELEITETTAADTYPADLEILAGLGVRIAIDDFGTGFSSLISVKELPAHVLKIDRAFVRDLATSSDSAAIVRASLGLAENFRYEVVAEGIEQDQELNLLRQWTCPLGQGYRFARPLWPAGIAAAFSRES